MNKIIFIVLFSTLLDASDLRGNLPTQKSYQVYDTLNERFGVTYSVLNKTLKSETNEDKEPHNSNNENLNNTLIKKVELEKRQRVNFRAAVIKNQRDDWKKHNFHGRKQDDYDYDDNDYDDESYDNYNNDYENSDYDSNDEGNEEEDYDSDRDFFRNFKSNKKGHKFKKKTMFAKGINKDGSQHEMGRGSTSNRFLKPTSETSDEFIFKKISCLKDNVLSLELKNSVLRDQNGKLGVMNMGHQLQFLTETNLKDALNYVGWAVGEDGVLMLNGNNVFYHCKIANTYFIYDHLVQDDCHPIELNVVKLASCQ